MNRSGALAMLLLALWLTAAFPARAAEEWTVIRVSDEDRAAVIRTPEGGLALIAEGGRIPGVGRVVEISAERILVEGDGNSAGETLLICMEGGRAEMIRIRRTGGEKPGLLAPGPGLGP